MGIDANHRVTTAIGWVIGVMISLLNVVLIYLTVSAKARHSADWRLAFGVVRPAQLEEFVQQGIHLTYRRQSPTTLAVGTTNADQQSQFTFDRVPVSRAVAYRSVH